MRWIGYFALDMLCKAGSAEDCFEQAQAIGFIVNVVYPDIHTTNKRMR